MLIIKENIEDKAYHDKEWYKRMDTLVGKNLDTTSEFENSLTIGQKIIFEADPNDGDKVPFPQGLSIKPDSGISEVDFAEKTLIVQNKIINGGVIIIEVGIRGSELGD